MARHPLPQHHPSDDLLLAHAAGSSAEAVSLVVATHLALCPSCRAEVERLEALGGVLIEELTPAPLPPTLLQRTLSRLDEPHSKREAPSAAPQGNVVAPGGHRDSDGLLPRPLRDYLESPLDALPWHHVGPAALVELTEGKAGLRAYLLKIEPGTSIPRHSHEGLELALVLAGGFNEQRGHFRRGDISQADPSLVHGQAIEQGRDCLCLLATDGPLELAELFGSTAD